MPTDELLARLADVELPPAPDWRPYVLAGMALTLLALVGTALLMLRRRRGTVQRLASPNHNARQRIAELQQASARGEVTARTTAYRLATALRLGLGLTRLDERAPPPHVDGHDWMRLLHHLATARYARHTPTIDAEDFATVDRWLTRQDAQRGHPG